MGDWNGKRTVKLQKLYDEYAMMTGFYPDGNEQFDPNFMSYDLWIELIEIAIEQKTLIEDIVGDEFLMDT